MELPPTEYEVQLKAAKQTITLLEDRLYAVKRNLEKDPNNTAFHRELKNLTLDMTITINELEHAESALERCGIRNLVDKL